MVKHVHATRSIPHLRSSASHLSLNSSSSTAPMAPSDQTLRYIATLEAQVANLMLQREFDNHVNASTTAPAATPSLFEGFFSEQPGTGRLLRKLADEDKKSLFELYKDGLGLKTEESRGRNSIPSEAMCDEELPRSKAIDPASYTDPFCAFLTKNPTVFHAVDYFEKQLREAGFEGVCLVYPVSHGLAGRS
jgi:hypothetical protein